MSNYYDFDYINNAYSKVNPSAIHSRNTGLTRYFQKYLFEKVLSVFTFDGIPDWWDEDFFKAFLFGQGFVAVIDSKFGPIPMNCSLAGINVFYQPKEILIANPELPDIHRLEIGTEAALIKMQPTYTGALDIVQFYADMMAVSAETAAINIVNSKLAYIFMADNKAKAESFKKAYDRLASGLPMTVMDTNLFKEDGTPNWLTFSQNLGQNYIAGQILDDMKKWEDRFNTDIGIPNANTQKKERLITDEVNANNIDTRTKSDLWLATISRGLAEANKLFGLNISIRYTKEPSEGFKMALEEGEENE